MPPAATTDFGRDNTRLAPIPSTFVLLFARLAARGETQRLSIKSISASREWFQRRSCKSSAARPPCWRSIGQTSEEMQLSSLLLLALASLTHAYNLPAFGLRGGSNDRARSAVNGRAAAPTMASDGLKVIICGAPASGKGTQCELLKEQYGLVHLSTGDMLRAAVKDGTEVGLKAKEAMESGKLVSDDIIIGIVKDRLAESDCKSNGWLLDGFPRTEAQAKELEAAGIVPDKVLYLEVPDDMLIERVVGRRLDPETGKIYHVKYFPPESDEVAARLTQRADDTEEKARVRLEQFHSNMKAVESCYAGNIVKFDGTTKKEQVFDNLKKCLDEIK
jgi:adenylate kinase